MLARIKLAAPYALLLLAVAANVYGWHLTWHAYLEEKEHAEWLYGCTQFQRPEACENDWQRHYSTGATPPWGGL